MRYAFKAVDFGANCGVGWAVALGVNGVVVWPTGE
jgi:hypothetical protein